jgi:DNA end-binding protein Ku
VEPSSIGGRIAFTHLGGIRENDMSVTVWKGHLTFGLVSIPVRLFRAARRERISLHQLRRGEQPAGPDYVEPPARVMPGAAPPAMAIPTAGRSGVGEPSGPATVDVAPVERVRQELFARETQVPIPRSELLKGYEFEKDRYVVIDKEDIEKITPKTATEMQIVEFVKLAEIDPIYLETSYYVSPEGAGEKPYALLFEALRESGYVALAEFAMRGRQHAVILRAGATGIIAHTMYYADEIRKGDEFRTNAGLATKKERDLAIALIEAMAAPFEPEKSAETVDIMEALQASLAARSQARGFSAESGSQTQKENVGDQEHKHQ